MRYKKGQLLLWRSGFGCDLVRYAGKVTSYGRTACENLTGKYPGVGSFLDTELTPTTEEIYLRYKRRYWTN